MWRILRGLIFLAVLAALGVTGYAYLGDLAPEQTEIRDRVVLDGG